MALVKVVEDIKQATRARVRNASPERAQRATAAGPSRLPMAFGADVAYIRLPRHPAILTTNLLECLWRSVVAASMLFPMLAAPVLAKPYFRRSVKLPEMVIEPAHDGLDDINAGPRA